MVSHNRTPVSVITAPVRVFGVIWEHRGQNRAQRRRPRKYGGTAPGFNLPYRRPTGEKGAVHT